MKRAEVRIKGRVHGVLFRQTARRHAERLGLVGWIRNEADGSVTVVAEGDEAALNQFLEWCRKGSPLARVDGIEVAWQEASGVFRRFEFLR